MRLIEELSKYSTVLTAFKNYMKAIHNVDPDKYVSTVPNANAIPQLINFLEQTHKVDFIDVVYYTKANTIHEGLSYNEVVMKGIKVVFHLIENKQELNFELF